MQYSLVVRIAAAVAAATAIGTVVTVGQFWPFSSYAEVVDVNDRTRRYCRTAEHAVAGNDLTPRQGLQLAARDHGAATKCNVRATARG